MNLRVICTGLFAVTAASSAWAGHPRPGSHRGFGSQRGIRRQVWVEPGPACRAERRWGPRGCGVSFDYRNKRARLELGIAGLCARGPDKIVTRRGFVRGGHRGRLIDRLRGRSFGGFRNGRSAGCDVRPYRY